MKQSGIYKLVSRKDPALFYVGASGNLETRKRRHFSMEWRGHRNVHGRGDFDFIILRLCSEDELAYWEQWFISELQPTMNKDRFTDMAKGGNEARLAALHDLAREGYSTRFLSYEKQLLTIISDC